jgi:thiol-disulfide isomerase/thioredoxin
MKTLLILATIFTFSSCCKSNTCGGDSTTSCHSKTQKNKGTNPPAKGNEPEVTSEKVPLPSDDNEKPATTSDSTDKTSAMTLPTFKIPSLWGGNCTNSDYKGKVSIVEVWSMSCPHCIHQAVQLEELAKTLDFTKHSIVSIHAMDGIKSKDEINKHFTNKKINVCMDNMSFVGLVKSLPSKYHVRGIPHLFIVDSKGAIKEVLSGTQSKEELQKILSKYK